jgi:5-methylcytosine-specific restriction endonuclease McrA
MLRPKVETIDASIAQPPPKTVDSIYQTPEYANWRALVIGRARGFCQKCPREGVRLFADHIIELKDGGAAFDPTNGQALCGSCHTKKTAEARAARQRQGVPKSPRP